MAIAIIQRIHDGQLETEKRPQDRTQVAYESKNAHVGVLEISQNPSSIDVANGHGPCGQERGQQVHGKGNLMRPR